MLATSVMQESGVEPEKSLSSSGKSAGERGMGEEEKVDVRGECLVGTAPPAISQQSLAGLVLDAQSGIRGARCTRISCEQRGIANRAQTGAPARLHGVPPPRCLSLRRARQVLVHGGAVPARQARNMGLRRP